MTARQPRRTRRRNVPADSLPRLRPGDARPGNASGDAQAASGRSRVREHNVTSDYRYVRTEMVAIGIVSVVTFGFVAIASLFF